MSRSPHSSALRSREPSRAALDSSEPDLPLNRRRFGTVCRHRPRKVEVMVPGMNPRRTHDSASTHKLLGLWVALAACVLLTSVASGQEQGSTIEKTTETTSNSRQTGIPPGETDKKPETEVTHQDKKTSSGGSSWIVAPLPISSPALGTGIIPVLGYIFPLQK